MTLKRLSTGSILGQSHRTDAHSPRRYSLLAVLAIAGLLSLLASAWLLPFVSEFSLVGDNISELVLGRYGFVQTAAFLLSGCGILALAFALWHLTERSWGTSLGVLLIGVYGMGAILVGIFPTDRVDSQAGVWSQSPTGMIHAIVALISFICGILAMFVLAWALRRQRGWRSLALWSALLAGAALALFLGQNEGPRVGLLQRLLVTVISAWLILLALRVRTLTASADAGAAASVGPP
jgi:hypothetical protein